MTCACGSITMYGLSRGRSVGVGTNPAGPITQQFSNLACDVVKTIDGDGNVTSQTFNVRRRMHSGSPTATGNMATMAYYVAGNLIQPRDARGKSSFTAYDGDERTSTEVAVDGNTARQFYVGNDGAICRGNAQRRASAVTYDAAMRLTEEEDSLGNVTDSFTTVKTNDDYDWTDQ